MINRIIDFSVENKVVVFTLVLAACVAGWWSMQRVALDDKSGADFRSTTPHKRDLHKNDIATLHGVLG